MYKCPFCSFTYEADNKIEQVIEHVQTHIGKETSGFTPEIIPIIQPS